MRHDELLLSIAAYRAAWRPRDVNRLPDPLTGPIESLEELHTRAIDLAQAEVTFRGSNEDWGLLRELALVIAAAAARARYLDSVPIHQ